MACDRRFERTPRLVGCADAAFDLRLQPRVRRLFRRESGSPRDGLERFEHPALRLQRKGQDEPALGMIGIAVRQRTGRRLSLGVPPAGDQRAGEVAEEFDGPW